MSMTTFSGPVRSLAGFITGSDAVSAPVTASTLAVTEDYNGEVIPLSRAGGIAVTLPAATGSQAVYSFVVSTTFTSSATIKVANATDVMLGAATISGSANSNVFATLSASDTITMNGTTTGGIAGSYIQLRDISSGEWIVNANLVGSGVLATPFSATVS